jgi:membrane-bound metal-dependent hydrolase YbcI (DUF457 family)
MLAALVHVIPLRSFKKGWVDEFLAILAAAGIAFWPGLDLTELAPAVLIGTLTHALGDAITRQGIPFFWPLSKESFRLAHLKAGGPTELYLIRPLAMLAIPAIPLWEPVRVALGH